MNIPVWQQVTFLSIVFSIYFLVNFYLYRRFRHVPMPRLFRIKFYILFFISVFAYPIGTVGFRMTRMLVFRYVSLIGSIYMAVMMAGFFFVLLLDVLFFLNYLFKIISIDKLRNNKRLNLILFVAILSLITIEIGYGIINNRIIQISSYDIEVSHPTYSGTIKAAIASDIHLSLITREGFIEEVAEEINALEPDIVLIAGDVIDRDVREVFDSEVYKDFHLINSKYGVYGVTGNHEFFGGLEGNIEYLEKCKIDVLQDTVVMIDSLFYLAGRYDRAISRISRERKALEEILAMQEMDLPTILMDHTPFDVHENAAAGIDVMISGHTHNGQIFPANFITEAIYELSWGHKIIDGMHLVVSCGVGTWGPPVRTGSYPEIIELNINFVKSD